MQLLLDEYYTASALMVRDQQPKVAVCTSSCPARLRRALACSQPWNPDKIIIIDSSPSRCSNRASLFACMHKVVIRASLVREARHQAGLGDVRKKKNLRDRIGRLVVSKTALDLICRLEVPSSVKSASHRLYLEEVVFGDASRYSRITISRHGEKAASEAIGDAAVHERQSTPSAILSRLAKKRHANPYHINLKLYSPVYHVERAGLGFNKVCGCFAASCQAALPQPLLACLSRLPCHGNHLSTLSSQRPLPCSKSGHCYGARKNHGKPLRTIPST